MRMRGSTVVPVSVGFLWRSMIATYEKKEVEEETDTLHSLTTVQLVIDQQRGHVVPDERDTNVNQVPQPSGHDAL